MSESCLPPHAWVSALASLRGMGPVRLGAILSRWSPQEAWEHVCAGNTHRDEHLVRSARSLGEELSLRWRASARALDVAALWEAHRVAGVTVLVPGDRGFPDALVSDPDPPAVLFVKGSLGALDGPRVAIVGTRRCTPVGRSVAHEIGLALAEEGVCVCSGLALGIDAAAHQGALMVGKNHGAAPVGVVGTGLDVVYPRRNKELWSAVGEAGLLISEYPLGTPPEPWRFPARNRLLAGIADVVVVVESHDRGGSLHTVEAALARDTTVMAVPGSVRSPASAGTNELLAIGCAPARDAQDVLIALGLEVTRPASKRTNAARRSASVKRELGQQSSDVLEALGWEPANLDQIVLRTSLSPVIVAQVLTELKSGGHVISRGSWWERQ